MVSAPGAPFPALDEFLLGFVLAQCLLLGIWAALGCLPLLVRWALVSSTYLLGVVAFAVAARQSLESWIDILGPALLGAMLVTVFAALLLPLRGLLAWRLDFDPRRHAPLIGRRGQVGFMSIAAFSLAVAAPLTIVRLLAESFPEDGIDVLFSVSMAVAMLIGVSAGPAAYVLLGWCRLSLAIAAAPCWCALIALAHALLSLWIPALCFFDSEHAWLDDCRQTAAFHTGIAACIIPTFTALRLTGLKLFALEYAKAANADPCHPRPSAAALPPATTLPKAA
jgi:hypothetical protein